MDFRAIFYALGALLCALAALLCVPAVVGAVAGEEVVLAFAVVAAVCLFLGVSLVLANRMERFRVTALEAFLLTTLVWVTTALVAALPLMAEPLALTFTDAFFETMSGITTTGSTILGNLDEMPRSILLWRALLQWCGGVGFILIAVAILPELKVGGMQLFRIEFSDGSAKLWPRAAQIAAGIGVTYFFLTFLCVVLLWWVGMGVFDAVAHGMTTIATGGFSTHDSSIGWFDSAAVDGVVTVFMILGSLPFVLYLRLVRGEGRRFFHDSQLRAFLGLTLGGVMLLTLWRVMQGGDFVESLRVVAFNLVSLMTGTGFVTADVTAWGAFAVTLALFFMLVGGCAGSTTCGVKVFRLQIVFAVIVCHMRRLLRPNAVVLPYYQGEPVAEEIYESVLAFVFLFILFFAGLALALSWAGVDFQTSLTAAATSIANVGPALGEAIGPEQNFASLPVAAKWLMSGGMLLGRLELYTVLVLLLPRTWRQ